MSSFVPESMIIPSGIETRDFIIRALTINGLVKDYDAVMSSIDHLKGVFGPRSSWPSRDLTLEQDLVDLGWHQKEFEIRNSFAYTVMNLEETICLGCVYIEPSEKTGYDAKVICWVRKSEIQNGLDEKLFSTVKLWLSKEWSFNKIAFPGRELSWEQWDKLADKQINFRNS